MRRGEQPRGGLLHERGVRQGVDYEVNVRTYREIDALKELVQTKQAQLAQMETTIRSR